MNQMKIKIMNEAPVVRIDEATADDRGPLDEISDVNHWM
jgi:hypothetical protein